MPLYNYNQNLSAPFMGIQYRKFGENPNAGTSRGLIWPLNQSPDAYPWPTTAQTVDVISDDPADTGLVILVTGLNDPSLGGIQIVEAVAVGSTSVNEFYRVYRMIVVGTTVNAGQVTAQHGADILAVIAAGDGQTQQCFGTIPGNKTLYISTILLALGANRGADFEIWVRDTATPFLKQGRFYIEDTSVVMHIEPAAPIDPLADWYIAATLSQAGGVAAQVMGTLIST